MERQMTINMPQSINNRLSSTFSKITERLNMPIRKLSSYYAMVLERDINSKQTWALLEAQAAFFLGILPIDYAFIVRLAALVWLLIALKRCKELL